ncbi:MAG TPA: cofactor-independent phosphoglycerate mutase [Polyangia bacterium]|nr:cofactor-independent phosphoglycerate mutase [Polyangia bacterium]
MKYVVFLIDGMADYPLPELGGKTPVEIAHTPTLDRLAQAAQFGTFVTLPEAFPTSSDVANMSVLGWDLSSAYTGRGAIESYGLGVPLDDRTVAFRMNLIAVKGEILEDYSAGHISEPEATEIIAFLSDKLGTDKIRFKRGVSYRHILYLVGREFSADVAYDKPDSSQGMNWQQILPRAAKPEAEPTAELLRQLVLRSRDLLEDHPVNVRRRAEGKNPANLIWPWSGGRKPQMPSFEKLHGKKGGIISAVDVILGLGLLGGMESLRPEGATGFLDTNYENKAAAAVDLLRRNDFVYVHVEAVDECGHLGDLANKIKGIEDCDARLIKVFLDQYRKVHTDKLRVMVLPDHPVPVKLRKHTRDPVPFMVCGEGVSGDPALQNYSEATGAAGRYPGLAGRALMDLLFSSTIP